MINNLVAMWVRMLPSVVVVNVATLGPLGFWGRAPGTVGSVAGLIAYTLFFYKSSALFYFIGCVFLVYLAVVFCGEASARMFKKDPSEVILDEFVAVPLCFIGLEGLMVEYPMWLVMLVGFGLFRFFDILKPLGIKRLQNLEGGVGIVVDDVVAGLYTCGVLHLAWYFLRV